MTEAAPGVERSERQRSTAQESLYAPREDLPEARAWTFRTVKWLVMAATLGIYYVVPWLRWDRGSRPAGPGGAARLCDTALLLFLPRDLAAGILLRHRPAGAGRPGAVSRHVSRGARLVRLYLPADGVDRSDDCGRAVLAGRPQRALRLDKSAGVVQDVGEGRDAYLLARHRARYRRRLRFLFPRRADACRQLARRTRR